MKIPQLSLKQGVSTLALRAFWPGKSWFGEPVSCTVYVYSIPGLYPQMTVNTTPHPQAGITNIIKVREWGGSPLVDNHCSKETKESSIWSESQRASSPGTQLQAEITFPSVFPSPYTASQNSMDKITLNKIL